jgi:hypothetical protein
MRLIICTCLVFALAAFVGHPRAHAQSSRGVVSCDRDGRNCHPCRYAGNDTWDCGE